MPHTQPPHTRSRAPHTRGSNLLSAPPRVSLHLPSTRVTATESMRLPHHNEHTQAAAFLSTAHVQPQHSGRVSPRPHTLSKRCSGPSKVGEALARSKGSQLTPTTVEVRAQRTPTRRGAPRANGVVAGRQAPPLSRLPTPLEPPRFVGDRPSALSRLDHRRRRRGGAAARQVAALRHPQAEQAAAAAAPPPATTWRRGRATVAAGEGVGGYTPSVDERTRSSVAETGVPAGAAAEASCSPLSVLSAGARWAASTELARLRSDARSSAAGCGAAPPPESRERAAPSCSPSCEKSSRRSVVPTEKPLAALGTTATASSSSRSSSEPSGTVPTTIDAELV
mmetsp:Transcript_644/g.2035  ORF Transcript_644/g.2035 Transcript_644/m.2035 type:complete len:337 (+) Transcript_644:149-1159(+)